MNRNQQVMILGVKTMKDKIILRDCFTSWQIDGIFSHLFPPNGDNDIWNNDYNQYLDLDYLGNYSGEKTISNLVRLLLDENKKLTSAALDRLSDIIHSLYNDKWSGLWATQNLEYNPIENYNMRERLTNDSTVKNYGHTNTRTDNLTHAKTGTETESPNIPRSIAYCNPLVYCLPITDTYRLFSQPS